MNNKDLMVTTGELRIMLENKEPVIVLDIRPQDQREEWQIPGSIYVDAYKRLNANDLTVLDDIEIPGNSKVVTVCAAGRTSQVASDALRKKGIEAYSLEGGMKAWTMAWNTADKKFDGFEVIQVRRTGKGCLSYIIFSGSEAIIIDASLSVEVYTELIKKRQLNVKYVLETHIHADHLSRSRQVADYFQVPLFLPEPNKVQFQFNKIKADTQFSIGTVKLRVLPTPGHTIESVSFYLPNQVIFTGDTIFTNGVGRPDLKSNEEETRRKAVLLYNSLKNLLLLPDKVLILPAHTNQPVAFDEQLIAITISEAKEKIGILKNNEEQFVNTLLQKIPATPANYLTIVEKNLEGDYSNVNSSELEAGANRCAIS